MVVAATRATAAVAAVVLIVVRRVSLMAIALRVLTVTLRRVLMRILLVPKRIHGPKRRQAHTQVALSNRHGHLMVATTAVTTTIAHRALAVTPVTMVAATSVVVKTAVQRLLIAVVRTRVSVLHALTRIHVPTRRPVPTKVVKSVVHSAAIVHMLVLPLVTASAMIAQRVLSATVIRVRLLIAHHAPILIVRIAVIVSHVRSALPLPGANTHRVHVPSVRSHSSAQSVRNTRHVQRVRSSMKLARRVTRSPLLVRPQRHRLMVVIAPHVALPNRLNMLQR